MVLSSWSLQCREETKICNRRTRQLKAKYSEGNKVMQLEPPQLLWRDPALFTCSSVPRRHVCSKCLTGELVRSHEDCMMDQEVGVFPNDYILGFQGNPIFQLKYETSFFHYYTLWGYIRF